MGTFVPERWGEGTQPDTLEDLQDYILDEDIAWWVSRDSVTVISQNGGGHSTTEAYGATAAPTTILIDQTG